ncbi:hypothetical protein J2W91_004638 [Paenibacillus amylolyticus]|uniref:Conjugal transfer protein TraL n=1 Tax=Paenibacillus amylolyticus TaxID=1451 RepID=A0AAP5H5A3_PAEAM|nr:conjugal transfer protein TrbL family protein [Paenibacillus amylolyticus]MDR6726132.1 hypothetical protein [Paenibacillus amylolyticus]
MKIAKWLTSLFILLTLSITIDPVVSFADEGSYYNENKDFFDNAPESYVDFIKKYDPDQRTVSCGRFDVSCHVYKIALDSGVSAMDFIKDLMKKTVISPTDIIGNSSYEAYKDGIFALSKIVLAIFIAFNAAKIVSLRMGDADDSVTVWNEKIVSIVVSAFFLFVYDSIIEWILHAQELLMHEIIDTINSENMILNMITNILMGPGLFSIIVILIIGILLIVLMLQLFYRTAFVAILYIAGPIAIATKINDTYNFFDFWLKNFIIAFVTLALQLIAIAVGLNQFLIPPSYFGDTYHLFMGAAFFILALTLPSVLGQWGFSTGSARSVASGAKSAVRMMVLKRK